MINNGSKKTAVAGAVAAALALGATSTQADVLMFPYVVGSNTVTTLMTIVSHTSNLSPPNSRLHYIYYYKDDPENNDAVCQETDYFENTSDEDIITVNARNNLGAVSGVMFNDPGAGPGNLYSATHDVLDSVTPFRAFLMVDNETSSDGEMYGEAFVMEFLTGAAWGYRAYNSADGGFDFGNAEEVHGEVLEDSEFTPIHLMPLDEFETRLFVTPVSSDDQRNAALTTMVEFTSEDTDSLAGEVWDRDENELSGGIPDNVTCVGAISASNMFSTATYNLIEASGGWTYVDVDVPNLTTNEINIEGKQATGEAVIFKLEFNTGSTFNGAAIDGTFNNAIWLLDNGGDGYDAF